MRVLDPLDRVAVWSGGVTLEGRRRRTRLHTLLTECCQEDRDRVRLREPNGRDDPFRRLQQSWFMITSMTFARSHRGVAWGVFVAPCTGSDPTVIFTAPMPLPSAPEVAS